MKAVGYKIPLPIEDPESLLDIDVPTPVASGVDLLVKVKAIWVNPVDVKVRASVRPEGNGYKILGWDARELWRRPAPTARCLSPGDEVFYAGSIARAGTNA